MSRLHLVTSRKPISGAIHCKDRLIFMDADTAPALLQEISQENPEVPVDAFLILAEEGEALGRAGHAPPLQAKNIETGVLHGVRVIGYEEMVAMCETCESIVSW